MAAAPALWGSYPGRSGNRRRRPHFGIILCHTKRPTCFATFGILSIIRKCWSKLTTAIPENRRFGTKAIRRATLTWLAERNPLVSRLVAGYRKLDVLEDFYIQRDVIINLLETVPTPKGWDLE